MLMQNGRLFLYFPLLTGNMIFETVHIPPETSMFLVGTTLNTIKRKSVVVKSHSVKKSRTQQDKM